MINMRKINTLFTAIAINSLVCANAFSQTKIATISSILDSPVEGEEVTLRGKIIGQEEGDTDYILTDGADQITIQIPDNDFPYNPNTTVEVSGVVDFESQHPEEIKTETTPEDIQIKVNQLEVVTSNE